MLLSVSLGEDDMDALFEDNNDEKDQHKPVHSDSAC